MYIRRIAQPAHSSDQFVIMDAYLKSCQDFLLYPTNVLETKLGAHVLQAYHTRLQHQKNRLFVDESQASVSCLDLTRSNKGMHSLLSVPIHALVLRTLEDPNPKTWNNLNDVKLEVGETSQIEQKKSHCRFM